MRWMDLEPVIQSEVSQKEKKTQISYITTCIWNLENGTDETVCRTGIETQVLRTDLWTQQGKEGVDRIGRGAVTYIHRYV